MTTTGGVIPVAALQAKIDQAEQKLAQCRAEAQKLEDRIKTLRSLLAEAVPGSDHEGDDNDLDRDGAGTVTRSRGITKAIVDAVRDNPGIDADGLEAMLTTVIPEDKNRRRVLLNNIGNMVRNKRLFRDANGGLTTPPEEEPGTTAQ